MYLLDTDVLSATWHPARAPRIAAWLQGRAEQEMFLSVITLGEIERGILQQEAQAPDRATELRTWLDRTATLFGDRLLEFGPDDVRIWGRLSHQIAQGGVELMIAATALRHGATIVTGNPAAFRPTGVSVEGLF
ncbi:type II toxin-antitoxin system VapC family toxin [Aliiroseovarius sp. YM-037]|uniref:type II toxin-antitoxin system VapC family toxin n=1 Tax=Aliiroseovarius sp. YM-037 TaxID=3341728 RepID=UPI003A7F8959